MWALVPIRRLWQAKKRLSGLLSPDQRYRLSRAMLLDVLDALVGTQGIAGVTVVSQDAETLELAQAMGAECLRESELGTQGLNAAVTAAAGVLAQRGIADVMVVHGDLPLLTREDLLTMLRCHARLERPSLTIVTDRQGSGSNCVLASPARGFNYRFGVNSRHAHVEVASEQGRNFEVLQLPGASVDIDTPEDFSLLCELIASRASGHTVGLLRPAGSGRSLHEPPSSG